jgi:hypothetical protein
MVEAPTMTIIDIKPEVQPELNHQAASHGVDTGAYAGSATDACCVQWFPF